ncbi:methylated-DNA--[protein]-cysteine S-methyltransferase [Nocardioides bruguierae]|uniref:Methylated-DNA--protein-cysteine methyltransferase n=1 Tax=Nocardioides bruguierae TaxID=2945102 RepID=A0A9X2IET4_9ACTN|nr:methylated-DNA--[protein]-cysteine S-methyltransferase [Nocardioides bruguierae]MCL8026578.1 methylated-DNA--[protein]-cysteine S-methyltransferase [Nocardioides bruguierae]MCM0619689.1 methylated-DNA--[protein]-cysteine S-methyltransferase [Nocardioides bruguierae]
MTWTVIESPVGPLRLRGGDAGLEAIDFSPFPDPDEAAGERDDASPVLARAARQLGEYFAGERRDFDLPLAPAGTEFQQRVWAELARIPWGSTSTYGDVAVRLGLKPGASRAVGLANGRNPIPVVVPCHRVIGANGTLTGYAGGLERKQVLLDLERDDADALF